MAWRSPLLAALFYILVKHNGTDALCHVASPLAEVAYAGTYEIHFPEQINGKLDTSRCRWHISAYRKGHSVHLEFVDVNITKDNDHNICLDEIIVYDGPDISNKVIAAFCGNQNFVTSSGETLVVYSTNKSSLGSQGFRLKYKAIRERHQEEDTSQILRIAFGAFIGAIVFIVVCSGAFRKYKQARGRNSSSSCCFGPHRVTASSDRNISTANTSVIGRRSVSSVRGRDRQSFRKMLIRLFQGTMFKLSTRRQQTQDTSTSESSDTVSQQQQTTAQQQQHPQRCAAQAVLCTGRSTSFCSANDLICVPRGRGSCGNYDEDLEFDISQPLQHPLDANLGIGNGHMHFGYQNIPITSFTSDPNAVRPPTYEDCVNSVNPLYLHYHNGQAFCNRAFNLKDEDQSCSGVFSPPPPYSEVHQSQEMSEMDIDSSHQPPHYDAPCTLTTLNMAVDFSAPHGLHMQHIRSCSDNLTPVSITHDRDHSATCVNASLRSVPLPGSAAPVPAEIEVKVEATGAESSNSTHLQLTYSKDMFTPQSQTPDTCNIARSSNEFLHLQVYPASPMLVENRCINATAPGDLHVSTAAPIDLLRRSGFVSSLPSEAIVDRRTFVPLSYNTIEEGNACHSVKMNEIESHSSSDNHQIPDVTLSASSHATNNVSANTIDIPNISNLVNNVNDTGAEAPSSSSLTNSRDREETEENANSSSAISPTTASPCQNTEASTPAGHRNNLFNRSLEGGLIFENDNRAKTDSTI